MVGVFVMAQKRAILNGSANSPLISFYFTRLSRETTIFGMVTVSLGVRTVNVFSCFCVFAAFELHLHCRTLGNFSFRPSPKVPVRRCNTLKHPGHRLDRISAFKIEFWF